MVPTLGTINIGGFFEGNSSTITVDFYISTEFVLFNEFYNIFNSFNLDSTYLDYFVSSN